MNVVHLNLGIQKKEKRKEKEEVEENDRFEWEIKYENEFKKQGEEREQSRLGETLMMYIEELRGG